MTERERDVRRLWHDQPREEHGMSVDEIRVKADRFERRVRRWKVTGAVVVLLVLVEEAWQVWSHPDLVERVGDTLTVAALIYLVYAFRAHATPQVMPAGLGLMQSADFYRQQLARQRDLADHPWRYLAPFVPGVALSLFGHAFDRSPAQNAAVALFGVGLFAAVAWWNRRTARRLQREIDELG